MGWPPSLLLLDLSKCTDHLWCSTVLPCSWALLTKGKVPYRHKMKVLDYLIKTCLHIPKRVLRDIGQRGKINNALTWLLLSSSQELSGHHRPTCKSIGWGDHLPVILQTGAVQVCKHDDLQGSRWTSQWVGETAQERWGGWDPMGQLWGW